MSLSASGPRPLPYTTLYLRGRGTGLTFCLLAILWVSHLGEATHMRTDGTCVPGSLVPETGSIQALPFPQRQDLEVTQEDEGASRIVRDQGAPSRAGGGCPQGLLVCCRAGQDGRGGEALRRGRGTRQSGIQWWAHCGGEESATEASTFPRDSWQCWDRRKLPVSPGCCSASGWPVLGMPQSRDECVEPSPVLPGRCVHVALALLMGRPRQVLTIPP